MTATDSGRGEVPEEDPSPMPEPNSQPPDDVATATPSAPDAKARTQVIRQSVLVGAAAGVNGISFGALSVAAGLSVPQTMALSLLMFTGGSQFAFIGVIGVGGAGAAAAVTATMMGLRNGFYALAMAPLLRPQGLRRLLAAHWTIDESTAVSSAQPSPWRARLGFWATGAAVFVIWNLFTLLGGVLGNALGDPRRYGFDAAAAAAFLGLLWPRLRELEPRLVALSAAALALVLVPISPAGVPILATVAVAALAALPGLNRERGVRS